MTSIQLDLFVTENHTPRKEIPMVRNLPEYEIGSYYAYDIEQGSKCFKLQSVDRFIFRFECGHWCTDTVFRFMQKVELP